MEIIVEILIQVLWWMLEVIGEVLLQGVFEVVAEIFGRRVKAPFRRTRPAHPALAALGYALFGAMAGGLSLWLMPTLFISTPWLRVLNLALTPLLAGLLMERLGNWRRGRDQSTIRLDTFAYGFVFALAMAVVRFVWGA